MLLFTHSPYYPDSGSAHLCSHNITTCALLLASLLWQTTYAELYVGGGGKGGPISAVTRSTSLTAPITTRTSPSIASVNGTSPVQFSIRTLNDSPRRSDLIRFAAITYASSPSPDPICNHLPTDPSRSSIVGVDAQLTSALPASTAVSGERRPPPTPPTTRGAPPPLAEIAAPDRNLQSLTGLAPSSSMPNFLPKKNPSTMTVLPIHLIPPIPKSLPSISRRPLSRSKPIKNELNLSFSEEK